MSEVYECTCGEEIKTFSGNPPEECIRCGNSITENFKWVRDE